MPRRQMVWCLPACKSTSALKHAYTLYRHTNTRTRSNIRTTQLTTFVRLRNINTSEDNAIESFVLYGKSTVKRALIVYWRESYYPSTDDENKKYQLNGRRMFIAPNFQYHFSVRIENAIRFRFRFYKVDVIWIRYGNSLVAIKIHTLQIHFLAFEIVFARVYK